MAATQALSLESPQRTPLLSGQGISLTLSGRIILDGVSFEVGEGEVFGIMGPNGCGKTSLLQCVTGIRKATLGTVWLNGKNVNHRDRRLRASMGVVYQSQSLDQKLTVLENLKLGARLFGISWREAHSRAFELLEFMGLKENAEDPVSILSGGLKRRLELARALIHTPKVLLLDEPTTGLDIPSIERTWNRLFALRRLRGLTVILTTHRPEEAERCDRVLVLDRGHSIACDTPQSLIAKVAGDVITVVAQQLGPLAEEMRQAHNLIVHELDDALVIEHREAHLLIPRLVEAFPGRFHSLTMRRPSMADAFLKLTGKTLESAIP